MIEDPDVIFVDFDDLFDSSALEGVFGPNDQYEAVRHKFDPNDPNESDDKFDANNPHDKKRSRTNKKELKPIEQKEKPVMTREQFYKIRPKVPRISKSDPRRSYASAFADAYNSCDFEEIWEFVSTYCTKDILFVHRWVGPELYLNFPKYLEVRGIESVAEYWFSRCVISPDLVLEMKETKLYVRSDGISTVLSSFTIVCTRLYDGEVSDSLICRPAVDPDLITDGAAHDSKHAESTLAVSEHATHHPATASVGSVEDLSSHSVDSDGDGSSAHNKSSGEEGEDDAKPDLICNRVLEKMELILSKVEPLPRKRVGGKRKQSEDSADLEIKTEKDSNAANTSSSTAEKSSVSTMAASRRKVLPKSTSTTFLGTVTLHLNTEHKIRTIELNFALQPDVKTQQQ